MRRALVLILVVALACVAAPDAARTPQVAAGVHVAGLSLGGLTAEPARVALENALAQPVPVTFQDETLYAWPDRLRVRGSLDDAIARALTAAAGTGITLGVDWSHAEVKAFVGEVARAFDRAPTPAQFVGIVRNRPVIHDAIPGRAVDTDALTASLEQELASGERSTILVPVHAAQAKRTRAHFGAIVWVDRSTNTLRLFDGRKLAKVLRVATGRPEYPTPTGLWHIVDKQQNPWWRPPDSPWAVGAKPIPPGPGNPLGTRWMGLDAAGVGLHGTPDAASIGYSASHGCIRMHISDAEWLFTRVAIGTPVYIT